MLDTDEFYNIEQIRALEQLAIEKYNIAETDLMQRAGHAAFELVNGLEDRPESIGIVCGKGNNAGDGFVVARLAHQSDYDVVVYTLCDIDELGGPAKQVALAAEKAGVPIEAFSVETELLEDLIIDAVLGIGIKGDVHGLASNAIEMINDTPGQIMAIDVPSGLDADTGCVRGVAVRADLTITYIGSKQGFYTADGPDHCGFLVTQDLALPTELFALVPITACRVEGEDFSAYMGHRKLNTHKGLYGHVLVIGGDYGMAGAVRMAGEAALRVGAGLVTVATRPEHITAVIATRPELMCYGVSDPKQLEPLIEQASVILIGPGLTASEWTEALWNQVKLTDKTLVIDGGAVHFAAKEKSAQPNWILTPHPGEAASLLDRTAEDIQANRFAAINDIVTRYQAATILKGLGTLIQAPGNLVEIATVGGPIMSIAGMGDVLAGMVAGLSAQHMQGFDAARFAAYFHGRAAVKVQENAERGILATDLFAVLPELLNQTFDIHYESDMDLDIEVL